MEQRQSLITLADTLATHQGVTHFAISMRALGKGDFFTKLKAGGDCRTATAAKVFGYFAANWPQDLEWPKGIPQPPMSNSVATGKQPRKAKRVAA